MTNVNKNEKTTLCNIVHRSQMAFFKVFFTRKLNSGPFKTGISQQYQTSWTKQAKFIFQRKV